MKTEYSAVDAQPVVLYTKIDGASPAAYPLIASAFGTLHVSTGLGIPAHNQQIIDEADPNNVIITYKNDGDTVATKTIVISGTTTTITVT
jgi:hypothetical protein